LGSHADRADSLTQGFDAKLAAPFAVIGVRVAGEKLTELVYLPREAAPLEPQTPFAREVWRQLVAYLDDPHFCFDLPVEPRGTEFQRRVWNVVCAIACGTTLSYQQVARRAGSAPRAVGMACAANRLPLVIPCHRVVGARDIGGFMHSRRGQGIAVKRWLLAHEGVVT
jgi:methylated-DNA-[protein]-cysteine S-methyltransferase